MRRFLGLTKPPSSQSEIDKTAPKKEPIIRSDSTKSETKKRATKSIERIKPPLPEKDIVGLGLNLAAEVPGTTSRAPSRHVAFVPTPLATPTLSALSPDLTASPFPVLTTQPSFESRHGLQLNCFPRSTPSATTPSNSTASNSSDQLQRPSAPLAHIPVQSFTNNSNRLSTHNPQVPPNRTSSSLSNKSNIIGRSPYGLNSFPSTSRLPLEGQDQVIQSAMTWSDLVSPDLVINLGERERTRQEVLYEVVASEERYVTELQSLLIHYVQPLLHPTSPTAPSLSIASTTTTYQSPPRAELPIAAKFLRSVKAHETEDSGIGLGSWGRSSEIPDMESTEEPNWQSTLRANRYQPLAARSHQSLPVPARGLDSSVSLLDFSPPLASTSNLASLPLRARHPLRKAISTARLHKKIPVEELQPPILPQGMKSALEVIESMLEGHESLAAQLKKKWTADFPLVRGLGGIWSDQPWFLICYSSYILSLEAALAAIDACLPSPHSSNAPFYSATSKVRTTAEKEDRKLAKLIMGLEEKAHEAGECGLAICLSKPLMRLGKLPLLMQSIFYHTDPSTMEYERTRAMALEIDRLVRSIETEVIAEDERTKVRDVLARIDAIQDKTLMAPRSTRMLIEETSVWLPDDNSPSTSTSSTKFNPRRAVSDVASHPPSTLQNRNASAMSSHSHKSIKRLSDFVRSTSNLSSRNSAPKFGSKQDIWMVTFTDVTLRCQRIGTTDIPDGFAVNTGKIKKKGKERNLYKFLKVERWEQKEVSESMLRRSRARDSSYDSQGRREVSIVETNETESGVDYDGESIMSFNYIHDEPTPNIRNFRQTPSGRSVSATTRSVSVLAHNQESQAKFGSRLRSPSPSHFSEPTHSSRIRARSTTPIPPPRSNTPFLNAPLLSPNLVVQRRFSGSSYRSIPASPTSPTSSPVPVSSHSVTSSPANSAVRTPSITENSFENYWQNDSVAFPVKF